MHPEFFLEKKSKQYNVLLQKGLLYIQYDLEPDSKGVASKTEVVSAKCQY